MVQRVTLQAMPAGAVEAVRLRANALGYRHGALSVTPNHQVMACGGAMNAGAWAERQGQTLVRVDSPTTVWHIYTRPYGLIACNGALVESEALMQADYRQRHRAERRALATRPRRMLRP